MNSLQRRIAYLEGLAEGLDLSSSHKEGKVLQEMISVIREIADHLEDFNFRFDEQEEYLEAIDDDLNDVETFLFEDEDEDDEYFFDDDLDDEDYDDEYLLDEYYDDDEEGFFEIECPNCQEFVLVDQDIFDDDQVAEVLCPECHEVILVNDDDSGEELPERSYLIDDEVDRQEQQFWSP